MLTSERAVLTTCVTLHSYTRRLVWLRNSPSGYDWEKCVYNLHYVDRGSRLRIDGSWLVELDRYIPREFVKWEKI